MTRRTHSSRVLFLIGGLLCLPVSAPAGSAPRGAAGQVFDKASPSIRLPGGPPGSPDFAQSRPSPDGKYVARLVVGEGEVGYLAVYHKGTGGWRLLQKGRVSRLFEDVGGCAWVPHHDHWLLVSAGGADYGEGLLALWTGEGAARILRRAKTPDANEGFNVRSVSADGRTVVYEHFGENSPDPGYRRNTRLRLTLPRA
jgi:hypothetical protein